MRLQTDDRQKDTKGVREGMSEHNTKEPEMIVIDIEEIKNKLLEDGWSLIEDDENENSFADVERFLDPYDDDIDSRTEIQRAEDERKDFDSRFPRCEELVTVYNNRVESLEKKQKLQDQKLVKWLVPLTVLIIFGFQIYLEKYGTGNMEKDLIVSFFWIPVVAFLALVFVFLGSDSEKKEQTDYKWLMEKIFPIIYEKYIRKKLPSIEFQKNIASLFPNGKKADYGFGIENRVIELYEMEITAIDRLSSKKGKEYLSFKGVCIYNKLNGKYQLISGMSILPPFAKGQILESSDFWTYYIITENAKKRVL